MKLNKVGEMYSYLGYGLNIHSAFQLPELLPAQQTEADVVINLGTVNYPHQQPREEREYCTMNSEEAFLFWEDFGTFLIRHGKEIIIEPRRGIEARALRLPLLGGGLAVLLHQRGFFLLHASAIAVDDGAVVFLGPKGLGKSSTAAAFYAHGHRLLSDDLVAVDLSDPQHPLIVPGFPQFKLWPEAAAQILDDDPEKLPWLASGYEKRSRNAADGFAPHPLPLLGMYVLSQGTELGLSPLSPQNAIGELIGNSYIARFGEKALYGAAAAAHLQQAVTIINQIPFYRLTRPDALYMLPSIVKLIKKHLVEVSAAKS